MKSASVLSLFLFGLIAVCSAQSDYCELSCGSVANIGCGNQGYFSWNCKLGTAMINMTETLKAAILDGHNARRNTLAGGNLPGYSPAVRMATMVWSDELATLASFNVKTCTFAHDGCHSTTEFPNSGQNIFKLSSGSTTFSDANVLYGLQLWWDESNQGSMSLLTPFTENSMQLGHFTAMANDANYAVGCAAISFPENGIHSLMLTCNYAYTNMLEEAVYEAGVTGSQCTTGMNPKYPALCSGAEVYDV